jgi:hypothetical protein
MPVIRYAAALAGAAAAAAVLSACGSSGTPAPAPTVTVTQPSGSAQPSGGTSPVAAAPPAIVAVTTHGALVALNPATGTATTTLVHGGVLGDEVSVSAGGMVYFAKKHGCSSEIEAVPVAGGSVADITAGSEPAVSADGTKLAYSVQPTLTAGCTPDSADLTSLYKLAIRTLSSGSTVLYPAVPASQDTGLPVPISHLSWAADNEHLAVSIASAEDNEGWNVVLVDTSAAQYYETGSGTVSVPVTGSPSVQRSYLREGIYLPDGDLFVSRACCAGVPTQNTSRLMWEVSTSGNLVHQVAVGYPNLDHVSLAASQDGNWLLYVAGGDLYVSQGGSTPKELATGFVAAAFA